MPQRNKFDIGKLQQAMEKKLKHMPAKMGNIAVRHFKDSFRKKGFVDKGIAKWKQTKQSNHRGSLMFRSGALMRSIRRTKTTANSAVIQAGGSHVPYAEIHNEGGTIKHPGGTAYFAQDGKAIFVSNDTASSYEYKYNRKMKRTKPHPIPIPKRQYMGRSYVLNARIKRMIKKEITKGI